MKLNAIAVALVLAATGSAHAAMDNSQSGNGSLILGLIDPIAQVSATFDLGVNMDSFLPSNAPLRQDWSLTAANYGSTWADFTAVADMSRVQYLVFAMDSTGTAVGNDRFLSTTNANMADNNNKPSNTQLLNFVGVSGGAGVDLFVNASNAMGTHGSEADGANIATAADGSAYLGNANAFGGTGKWKTSQSPFVAWAPVADELSFYMLTTSSSSGLSKASVTAYGPVPNYHFEMDYAQGILTAVPEPETYALMLAGLGLVGFMARRKVA